MVLQPRHRRNGPGLGCPLFARHYWGDHCFVFFSSGYLDVSVPRVRSLSGDATSWHRVAPFGDPRITGHYAPPHGLSQPIASFIASESQGIHHTPLVTFRPLMVLLGGPISRSVLVSLTIRQRTVRSFELCPPSPSQKRTLSGEYRSRTDDLLLAKQAL